MYQVRKLLDDDPGNSEYADMEKELVEVISLTEELLATAKQSEDSGVDVLTTVGAYPGFHHDQEPINMSDLSDKFPVGTKVQAVWSEDGEWYDGTIEAVTPNGYYVCYDGWVVNASLFTSLPMPWSLLPSQISDMESLPPLLLSMVRYRLLQFQVDPANVRPVQEGVVNALLEAEKEAEATKQAIKRKIAQAAVVDFQSRSLLEKLRIDPNDPEDVKIAKRKKIHAFKSKMRVEQLEVTQNKRQNAWQQFQTSKGRAKKIGFFSGRKRESIFKSPEDPNGKVGVTGSGKGLTDFQKREKHLHLKGANAESGED
ncbi:nucleic acid binding/RNA binding protein [Actinidia rufa]|uniref:Nucleic acid binding/RNA binding protein n=1 Tax=Actinidia rufa TaxID=165716 RepID=A0A7J0F8Z7_9ERIC|nr:nucleic acid binding/RNA binding protein [Actinidia rufa]